MFRRLGVALFGDGSMAAKETAAGEEPVNSPAPSTAGATTFGIPRTRDLGTQRYPGAGYTSAVLQYQEYPENVWQGWGGVAVACYMRPFQAQYWTQSLAPVTSGGSGIVHGQFYGAPLIDTSPQAAPTGEVG